MQRCKKLINSSAQDGTLDRRRMRFVWFLSKCACIAWGLTSGSSLKLQVGRALEVGPRLVDRRQRPLAEVLPGQVGGAAGGAGNDGGRSSSGGVERKLQLLDLANTTVDAEEVPGEAPVAASGAGAQSRHRAVRGEAEVDRVGTDAAASTGGGRGHGGGSVRVEVKVRRGLQHHPRVQEGSGRQLLVMLVQEVEGVRVLRRRRGRSSRRRRVGEREEQRRADAAVVVGEEEIAATAVAAVGGGGDGAAVIVRRRRENPRALLG